MVDRLLRLNAVLEMVALSRSQLYRLKKEGKFPASIKVGPKSVRWRESEIREWMNSLSTE